MSYISIVMPLFNKEKYVNEAVSSVLNQSYTEFELIILNDGSTDRSLHVVEQFSDNRIRIIDKKNDGVSATRNLGVSLASFDLIAFIDADDKWHADHLKILSATVTKYPEAGMFCNLYSQIENKMQPAHISNAEYKNYLCDVMQGAPMVWTSAVLLKKAIFMQTGGFPEGESHGEDLAVWVKAALLTTVVFSNYVGAYYRKTEDGLTAKLVEYPDGLTKTIDDLLLTNSLSYEQVQALIWLRENNALAQVITAYRHGEKSIAKKYLSIAGISKKLYKKYLILNFLSFFPKIISEKITQLHAGIKNQAKNDSNDIS